MFICYRYDMLNFLLCIRFNHNIYNQANKCSVKVDVWICLISLTKTTEQIVKLPFLYFFSTLFLHVPICYTVYML